MSPSRSMATPLLHLATLLLLLAATSAGAVAFPTGGRPGNGGGDRCPWIDQRARASRTDAWRAGETDQDRSEPSHPTTLTLCDYYPRQPNPPSPAAAVTITRGSIGSPSKSPTMDPLPNPPSSAAAAAATAAVPIPIDPDEKRMEEPVAKVSQKMPKLSVSSKPKKVGGTTRFAPEFRYHGCSWPEVVGLKLLNFGQYMQMRAMSVHCTEYRQTRRFTVACMTQYDGLEEEHVGSRTSSL